MSATIRVETDGSEIYELRPCDAPNPAMHRSTKLEFHDVDVEYDEAVSNYAGLWANYKVYIRIGDSWYELWQYAFHRTNGMGGSYSHRWEWKHVTSY